MKMNSKIYLSILLGICVGKELSAQNRNLNNADKRPNIIIILADDMGYSDLGCMGSKIHTPAIDSLAKHGISFSNFYNTGRCCPSRASLLTGQYAHKVGMGWMTAADLGTHGYKGDLDTNAITIAETLCRANYHCYMSGKWHVTADKFINNQASKHNWPLQRGFQKYFGILGGGDDYYKPNDLVIGNKIVDVPDSFYLTNAITDSALNFINQHQQQNAQAPFFCYVAYTTPHRPLHALRVDINKYKGVFKLGWDEMRLEKAKELIAKGWINSKTELTMKDKNIPDWEKISEGEKATWQARMEVYAAQIDRMDQGIAKIIALLKQTQQLDNTLILFLSDNGGNDEMEGREDVMQVSDIGKLGEAEPRHSYHREWAQLSNTPFRSYKSNIYEGGIASPLIVHWPNYIKKQGVLTKQMGHIVDVMPTILDAAGIDINSEKFKSVLANVDGKSLLNSFNGKEVKRGAVFFEHETACGIRLKKWKLVSPKSFVSPYIPKWELYNLETDRAENHNLVSKFPHKVKQLSSLWYKWAAKAQVLPLDGRGWLEKTKTH